MLTILKHDKNKNRISLSVSSHVFNIKVIVAASFLCNCIVDGIVYSFGFFLNSLSAHFVVDQATMTFAGSLLSGVYMCVGIKKT
jgi:hypothetical protein